MRRKIALWLALMLVLGCALAESAGNTIPRDAQWGQSRTRIRNQINGQTEPLIIGDNNALKVPGIIVGDYTMDAYYVFSENMRTYYGLSKVTYLLSGGQRRSSEMLDTAYAELVQNMEAAIGAPDSVKEAVTVWKKSKYRVEIGKGRFRKYDGSDQMNVAIVITGLNIPKPTPRPTPTPQPTPTPRPVIKEKDMKVTITATCEENDHVGNNWLKAYYVNGEKVTNGDTVHVKAGERVKVRANITEDDDNPDKGTGEGYHNLTEKGVRNGFNITLTFDVKENEGKHKGKVARWKVKFKFE